MRFLQPRDTQRRDFFSVSRAVSLDSPLALASVRTVRNYIIGIGKTVG
jgi:hypothetical protein